MRTDRHRRAGVGHRHRVVHGVTGVGRGVVGGVGHRQVGGPRPAGLHVGHHGGGVVALVGVVLPAHDGGGVGPGREVACRPPARRVNAP